MVQLLVLPSPDKMAWAEKLLLIRSSILSLPGRDPLLCEVAALAHLPKDPQPAITIIVAIMSAKPGEFTNPCLRLFEACRFFSSASQPCSSPQSNTNSGKKKLIKWNKRPATCCHCLLSQRFVLGTISDSTPQPPPKVRLSVMYITVREGRVCLFPCVCVCVCVCASEKDHINGTITARCMCVFSSVCIPLNASTVYQC